MYLPYYKYETHLHICFIETLFSFQCSTHRLSRDNLISITSSRFNVNNLFYLILSFVSTTEVAVRI
ncbi:hypothetical protein C4597_05360 [Weissella koreensis]|nr:hypothetical protein C4597_05360 [Weissella koreensis]